jgi:hypothetical protein
MKSTGWIGVSLGLMMCASCEIDSEQAGAGPKEAEPESSALTHALVGTGGIRILSDSNSSYALNAYGGATDGGPVQLWKDCPKSNSDCLWTYRNGMIVSATDSSLAVKGGTADRSSLTLSAACQPNDDSCSWIWSKGMLINKATGYPLHWKAVLGNPSPIELKNGCTSDDPTCTWTLESAPLASSSDPRLGVYAVGGLSMSPPSNLALGDCPQTDPACTWTFRKGMILSDLDPTYAVNAYGGAGLGTQLKAVQGCAKENPDCTWSIQRGQLVSDAPAVTVTPGKTSSLAVAATGGPFSNALLRLSPTSRDEFVAQRECIDADPTHPACPTGYGCFANNDKADSPVDDKCRSECPDEEAFDNQGSNPNCMFDVAPGLPTTWSGVPAAKAEWTILVVAMFDGDFSTDALAKLSQLSRAGSTDSVNIIEMVGTPSWYNYDGPRVADAAGHNNGGSHVPIYQGSTMYLRVNRNAPPTVLQDVGDVDMTKPDVLSAFGNFAITNFPANHYVLVQLDHGGGWGGYGQDASATVDPKSVVIANGDYAAILNNMTTAAGKKIDIVAFDACDMSDWEVGVATAQYADYLIGSQTGEGGAPWGYWTFLRQLIAQPTMSGEVLSRAMISAYDVGKTKNDNTLADTSLALLPALTTAVSNLGAAMNNPQLYACIDNARKLTIYEYDRSKRDLYDLADKLYTTCGITEAQAVKTALSSAVLQTNVDNPRPPLYPYWGLGIYMPPRCSLDGKLNKDGTPDRVTLDHFYYEDNGAPWGHNAQGAVWSQQTQWDEFLRGFVPADSEKTPPPPVLTAATQAGGTSVALSWTLPTTAYGLTYSVWRGTSPGSYASSPIAQVTTTTYTDSGLNPNLRYYYAVSATNCTDGAKSTEASSGLPTVSITSPANNATYTAPASITIEATASDDGGSISRVDFYQGTTFLGSDTTSPYSITWSNVAAGTYSLTAKAYDNTGGSTTSSPVVITVQSHDPCAGLCNPWVVKPGPGIQEGYLGTGSKCEETTANVSGGNCGNMTGRTLKVNGTTMTCNGATWSSLPPKRNGGYCFQVTAGGYAYAYFTTW